MSTDTDRSPAENGRSSSKRRPHDPRPERACCLKLVVGAVCFFLLAPTVHDWAGRSVLHYGTVGTRSAALRWILAGPLRPRVYHVDGADLVDLLPEIRRLMRSDDPETAARATYWCALGVPPNARLGAWDDLVEVAQTGSTSSRITALLGLRCAPDRAASVAIELLSYPEPAVRRHATRLLVMIDRPDPEVLAALRNVAASDADALAKDAAREYLKTLHPANHTSEGLTDYRLGDQEEETTQ